MSRRTPTRGQPLRRIVVGGSTYLWKVEHRHHVLAAPVAPGSGRCAERFSVFLEGHRRSPARVHFVDGAGRGAGYPLAGVVWLLDGGEANLNQPDVAWRLIEILRGAG